MEDVGIILDGADGLVPLQYTGSTDSAQNPIYEGDVVLWHTEDHFEGGYFRKKMVVGWNPRCMQFRLFEFPNEVGKNAGEQFWAEDVQVIGHIFDFENEECKYYLDDSVKGLIKPLGQTSRNFEKCEFCGQNLNDHSEKLCANI